MENVSKKLKTDFYIKAVEKFATFEVTFTGE
jgi:hypothetical protein